MLGLDHLTEAQARSIHTLAFDLDDTLLDHGLLGERAYAALFRLRETGLKLVACTGRPAGWAEIILRQWPIDLAIAENGAVAWRRDESGRARFWDPSPPPERAERRGRLLALRDQIMVAHPELGLADDNSARVTDITFDIGEHRLVDAPIVQRAQALASAAGVHTFASSVHLHITLDDVDKASGFVAACAARGSDPAKLLAHSGFVGDSTNDEAAFASFGITFAVANVARYLHLLRTPPRFVAKAEMGAGFAEIAEAIVAKRR